MAEKSEIAWCDSTFNPWIGCTKVSPGCDHCYAERDFDLRKHVARWGAGNPRHRTSAANWQLPIRWQRQAEKFRIEHGRRRRVFCASLSDVFDNEVPESWRADLFALIRETPDLDWLLLTKRIGNVARMVAEIADLPRDGSHAGDLMAHHWRNGTPPKNIWLGATVVNQTEVDRDVPKLLEIPAAVRFLSIEPMLGRVDLCESFGMWRSQTMQCFEGCSSTPINHHHDGRPGIGWVIVGGESGPGARPMHPDWPRAIRDQCAAAGVSFFFKQWGEWGPDWDGAMTCSSCGGTKFDWASPYEGIDICGQCGGDHWLDATRPLDVPCLVGKKRAGHLLDGVEHRQWPEPPK